MRARVVSAASAAGLLLATGLAITIAAPASAQAVIDDPLHLCYSAPGNCTGFNGVQISTNPSTGLSGWGASSSPAPQTGTLTIDLLIPDNDNEITLPGLTGSVTVNGVTTPLSGTFSLEAFTFGPLQDLFDLQGFTKAPGAPPNPYSAYAGATHALDPAFVNGTDHYVVLALTLTSDPTFTTGGASGLTNDLDNTFALTGGQFTVNGQAGTNDGLPNGTIITAFLTEAGGTVSAAQSSSVVLDADAPAVPEASTWGMMLAGFGLLGFAAMRKGKREAISVA